MKIAIGCDSAGFIFKTELIKDLIELGYEVVDCGPEEDSQVDYPIYAKKVSKLVSENEVPYGILICGTGIGMSIVANKFKGVRAALVTSVFQAQATKEHNDSNILCLGARVTELEDAKKFMKVWLDTPFSGIDRHIRRIKQIEE